MQRSVGRVAAAPGCTVHSKATQQEFIGAPKLCRRRQWYGQRSRNRPELEHDKRRHACCYAIAESEPAPVSPPIQLFRMEDKFIGKVLDLARQARSETSSATMDAVRQSAEADLQHLRMPNRQTEDYRFTDLASITRRELQVASGAVEASAVQSAMAQRVLSDDPAASILVVVRDGVVDSKSSRLDRLPEGAYIGSIATAPESAIRTLGLSRRVGGTLALMSTAIARDVLCIEIPSGVHIQQPIHVIYLSSSMGSGAVAVTAPYTVVSLGAGATAEIVEDFDAPLMEGPTFVNAVLEADLQEGSSLRHGYVQLESLGTAHIKSTVIRQHARSQYALTEACIGGDLARHDVDVQQVGEATDTVMRHFVLAAAGQLHDVHTRLTLDYPEGTASQLHKCIVAAASGRAVFDGNVKVQRGAQRTDAKQLTRNLLLVPKATVNVKPNLQIVADDVKCTHGCTVSDLEERQLFYFRSRGIDKNTAREMLVFSFGREVTQHLKHKKLQERLQAKVNAALALGFSQVASADSKKVGSQN